MGLFRPFTRTPRIPKTPIQPSPLTCRNLARSKPSLQNTSFRPISSRPDQEVLFTPTDFRWLCNEELHRKLRYTPFNVDAMEHIACKSVGARRCLSWSKISEGRRFYNEFLLQFDNDKAAVVRIPCPSLEGNIERSVASEVATMSFLAERWHEYQDRIPLPPRVITYNASYNNPAETPYIILEHTPGITLWSQWLQVENKASIHTIPDIMKYETFMLHAPFSQHGSLYFVEDVPEELQARPLLSVIPNDGLPDWPFFPSPATGKLVEHLEAKYCVGPTADREWWRGANGRVDADRGPWRDMPTMIKSAAELQLRALDAGSFAHPSSSSVLPTYTLEPTDIPLLRRLLQTCIDIAPLVDPGSKFPALSMPVLTHPHLAPQNIIVAAEGNASVLSITNWNGAQVLPFCTQSAHLPPALAYTGDLIALPSPGSCTPPAWPEGVAALPTQQQEVVRQHYQRALVHQACAVSMKVVDPVRFAARLTAMELAHGCADDDDDDVSRDEVDCGRVPGLAHMLYLGSLVPAILQCGREGPGALRGCLLQLQHDWGGIAGGQCPIDLSEEEASAHLREKAAAGEYKRCVDELYAEIGCSSDTSVEAARFGEAMEVVERRRAGWDEEATGGPFPIYEGAPLPYVPP